MTEANEMNTEVEDVQEKVCPGERLRIAREEKGLSIDTVASELKLQSSLIDAIEEGDMERLPPMAFVTGYLRSYARLMDMPADELVENFAQCTTEPPAIVSTSKERVQVSSKDLPMRMVTYLVVIGLVVLLATWGYTKRSEQPTETQLPGETVVEQQAEELTVAPVPVVEEGDTAEPVMETVEQESVETTPAMTEESAAAVETEQQQEESPEAVEAVVEQADEAQPPVLTADMPRSELRIELEEDSWLDIRDAAGRTLAYDLARAGVTRTLYGEAPFKIFLGYAPGVKLYFNGDPFDHQSFHRKDMARFSVGRAEDNTQR